jgi:hypothetical protein
LSYLNLNVSLPILITVDDNVGDRFVYGQPDIWNGRRFEAKSRRRFFNKTADLGQVIAFGRDLERKLVVHGGLNERV